MRTLKTQNTSGRTRRSCDKLKSTRRAHVLGRSDGEKKVMEKLQALKSLLPPMIQQSKSSSDDVGTEELFQDTADYIVRLRTQVVVLKKLIEICDNSSDQSKEVVL
ncbi:hypothetical protein CARUB_v10019100mg [Capsella rubella]|uniref:BHLH domain-containing protein n=1 Tax=Capsella rubella TaxID=81985 RepID=R0HP42_9BRAS|nr:uncharacterized protein LOC17887197 [Capsella rubella]EOA25738.1 hypothetical protein CARUB_v10019100mg [Capsella rubella]